MLTATVSGSFHRHMHAIERVVAELTDLGVKVLSPANPEVVDNLGDFLFVASDRFRSVRLVQDRHLESIRTSDFLWLVSPDGYVGQSASMELGFAVANEIPIFGTTKPSDLTLRQYVRFVQSLKYAVDNLESVLPVSKREHHFLINPHDSIEIAHDALERIENTLCKPVRDMNGHVAEDLYSERDKVANILTGFGAMRTVSRTQCESKFWHCA